MLNGASALAWWSSVCEVPIATLLDEARSLDRDAPVPLFLPHLQGERTPYNAPDARGAFLDLEGGLSRPQLTHAVIEGIAFSLRDGLDAMQRAGTQASHALLSGGGFRDPLVAQTVSDALGLPCTLPSGSTTGPAMGAARLAELMLGHEDECRSDAAGANFVPDPTQTEHLKDRLARWRHWVQIQFGYGPGIASTQFRGG
jgi:xylulokinase